MKASYTLRLPEDLRKKIKVEAERTDMSVNQYILYTLTKEIAYKEAAVFLIPLAPDLPDLEETREKYFNVIIDRLEKLTNQRLKDDIMFKKSYCVQDFKDDYNSFKGNAYGMANTLMQTAFLRPKLKSKKVKNLYFTGQLTVPGPGVPPALISGKIVSDLVTKENKTLHEKTI